MPDESYAAAHELWEKYRVLTHEMMKFVDADEIDTFIELVDQREQVVTLLRRGVGGIGGGTDAARDAAPVQGARVAEPLTPSECRRPQL